ncbi:hypothetical protein [Streptomyces sediminimaris]|uniref:hypothetical protein n=1 Tax=Streptomyces sediminimaris TaxID=3383721 RepID=UPI00399C1B7B
MSERRWQFVPRTRALSVLYLVAGVLLVVGAGIQLTHGVAVLTVVSAVLALALICLAGVGLVRPGSGSAVRRR